MAKRSHAKPTAARPTGQPRQHSLVWAQGLVCGALVTLATPTALLLGVLLGPALIAVILDGEPGRPTGRSVVLFGMAASVEPLKTLWTTGHNMQGAVSLVSSLEVVATAWSAAAAGWLLAQILPIAVRTVLEGMSIARSARLRAERAMLVSDWGFDQVDGTS
jgi:hypothetical protein